MIVKLDIIRHLVKGKTLVNNGQLLGLCCTTTSRIINYKLFILEHVTASASMKSTLIIYKVV